ncbi:hypothetical protein PRK78_006473 [Emydomyces testavorans]|uniref:EH domain-containing protein n=1 Tax=Emydomyces testavorans TaxID=2070801 RepID=A0AAF0DLF7_9EURO|nr:hypothetical protein PRK78_006473 [Emydomyces testavorans]
MPNERKGVSLNHEISREAGANAHSTALRGATIAFASQTDKTTAKASYGAKSGSAIKAAVIAGAEFANKRELQGNQQPNATVRDKIRQFSSIAAGPTGPSTLSLGNSTQILPITSEPQHVAAQLAVGRSAVQARSKPGTTLQMSMETDVCKPQRHDVGHSITSSSLSTDSAFHGDEPTISSPVSNEAAVSLPSRGFANSKSLAAGNQTDPTLRIDMSVQKSNPPLPPRRREAPPVPPRSSTLATDRELSIMVGSSQPLKIQKVPAAKHAIRPQHSYMSESSLADALAASSLASSRAPSPPQRDPKPPPPPPPPRHRRSRSRSLLQPSRSRSKSKSRTPSPTKGLKKTMRDESKFENETGSKKPPKRVMIKPHPHKHQEGNRKRWQDRITNSERKRYEGVWAANKGIARFGMMDDPDIEELRIRKSVAFEDLVLNLVVRDIWSRSRLPRVVLEDIWNLVSHDAIGMLSREEFVVGMWLIDQSLKGHKLPAKVSESVWDSVRTVCFGDKGPS